MSPFSFLAPWYVPLIAAGLAIPPLVLLYFLKLRRKEVPIASTLLWKRAVYDLQVNSPFQKLRNNLLLILQLLILLAAILALAEPMWAGHRDINKSLILLIDQSASMTTDEGDGRTRLEIAKEAARRVVDDMSSDQRALLIAFADRARVLTSLTDDKDELRRRIDSIEPTHMPGRLREAMTLAEAHSTPVGEGFGVDQQVALSHYIVFTDGRLPDARDIVVERGEMEIIRVGEATENVGIVGLDVRRNYERPEELSVLARVRNFGTEPAERDLSLLVDNELVDLRSLPPLEPLGKREALATTELAGTTTGASEAVVALDLTLHTEGQIEVRLSGEDALAVDDRAFAVAMPPRPLTALLVTPGNRYLADLVDAFDGTLIDSHEIWTPQQYEDADEKELVVDGRCRFDVVILDTHSTERLPPGNYLFFAGIPIIDGVEAGDKRKNDVFLDWDDTHPILRYVGVGSIKVFSWLDLTMPPEATTLIEATNGPILSLLNRERNQYLVCAFGIFDESRTYLNTDWVLQEGLVVFMSNALRYLAGASTIGQHPPVKPGEAFTVAARPGTDSVKVRYPNGESERVAPRRSGLVTFGGTDVVGFYEIDTEVPGETSRAVSLLDEQESFITSNKDFRIAAGEIEVAEATDRVNRPLWPWVLGAMGVLLLVEWIVYNRRMYV